jgi:3-hydroxymyristoyl/3-hydroxydecanoyl-(acyl carrier protein) dehydratase
MVSRINNVKLKHPVLPGDLMKIEVKIKERVGPAFYMTGKVTVRDRVALTLEFTALLVEDET